MLKLELELFPQPTNPSKDASQDAPEDVSEDVAEDVTIIIDVLRMTTTAAVLLAQGAAELYVVAEVEAARQLATQQQCLLLGERQGRALEGFDGGNSPCSYLQRDMRGQRAVLCTSNGSRAVAASRQARHVLLGAVVNAAATAERALELAHRSITLRCAATAGKLSLDDVLAAACLLRELCQRAPMQRSDTCSMALQLLPAAGVDFAEALQQQLLQAAHAQHLLELGFAADIRLACQLNRYNVVAERSPASSLTDIADIALMRPWQAA